MPTFNQLRRIDAAAKKSHINSMIWRIIGVLILVATVNVSADENFHTLKVKGDVYTNVTVTTVTATDIYFTHARGMASAKLKDLAPELQKHFHYDAAKGEKIAKAEAQATVDYHTRAAQQKSPPPQKPVAVEEKPAAPAGDDFVAPELYARSIRGGAPPPFQIEKWISDPPVTDGKFILIDFWATWCGPCRQSIPELNDLQSRFSDRLTVIGVSNEPEDAIHKMTSPTINYSVAIDTQSRMAQSLEIHAIPHCILIDPSGIVRFEGNPLSLNTQIVQHFLDKYGKQAP